MQDGTGPRPAAGSQFQGTRLSGTGWLTSSTRLKPGGSNTIRDDSRFRYRNKIKPWQQAGHRNRHHVSNTGLRLGTFAEAESAVREAIRLEPEFWHYSHLGKWCAAQGKLTEAEAAFREANRLDSRLESTQRRQDLMRLKQSHGGHQAKRSECVG